MPSKLGRGLVFDAVLLPDGEDEVSDAVAGICELLQHVGGRLTLGLFLGGAVAVNGDDADLARDGKVSLQKDSDDHVKPVLNMVSSLVFQAFCSMECTD